MSRKPFHNNCVSWERDEVDDLILLQDEADEIGRDRFVRLVDQEDLSSLERHLGYDRHLRMADDYHVTYHLHEPTGIPFLRHSAIEHVFATRTDLDALRERLETVREAEEEVPGM